MQVSLLGDFGAQRVDNDQPAAGPLGLANTPHEVQIGGRRIVAPDDVELSVLGEFGRAPGNAAIGPGPSFATHSAAQRPPIELGGAEPMEEPQGHAVPGEETVRASIVQRHHRLWSPAAGNRVDPLEDLI